MRKIVLFLSMLVFLLSGEYGIAANKEHFDTTITTVNDIDLRTYMNYSIQPIGMDASFVAHHDSY